MEEGLLFDATVLVLALSVRIYGEMIFAWSRRLVLTVQEFGHRQETDEVLQTAIQLFN